MTEREFLTIWGANKKRQGFWYYKIPDSAVWKGGDKNTRFTPKRPFDYILFDNRGVVFGEAKRVTGKSINFEKAFEQHQLDSFEEISFLGQSYPGNNPILACLLFVHTKFVERCQLSAYAKKNALIWRNEIIFAIEFVWDKKFCKGTQKIIDLISNYNVQLYKYFGTKTGFTKLKMRSL